MIRACLRCHQRFSPPDLAKEVSKEIEVERKSYGLQGLSFRCYVCPHCRRENLFIDIHPLPNETDHEFERRKEELRMTIEKSPHAGVQIAMVEPVPCKRQMESWGFERF